MGKKQGTKRAYEEDSDYSNDEHDAELEAELAALAAMRNEKSGISSATSIPISSVPGGYNKEGLLQCLESLGTESLPFIESLQVAQFDLDVQDEHDDLEREMVFYNHALQAVSVGRHQLDMLGVPHRRPNDYFAENIKDKLLLEEKKIDAFEKRKQREMNIKYNKQIALKKKEERTQATKAEISTVSAIRKSGGADKNEKLKNIIDNKTPMKSKKRQAMDKKYGFGAKERKRAKMNDAKSLNDFSEYNPKGGKAIRRDRAAAKAAKKPNRPGKAARQQKRSSRSAK